ncbi:two-component system sensor histidine kinase YesM [Paenibacillus sacheonensis]|nr:two-component system sensor histidine kinase YesM [Paenibacillus sacheonensis]
MKRLTIFPKLMLLFLIGVIPSFLVSLQFFQNGAMSVRKEIWGSMETRVRYNISSFEAEMNRLVRLHELYALDDDITKLSSMSSILPYYDVMQMQKRVQNKLWILETSSLYVAHAKAFIPQLNKTLLPLTDIAPMTGNEVEQLKNLNKTQQSPIAFWEGKLLINTINPNPNYVSSKNVLYILQSELDQYKLNVFLRQMLGESDEGALLFTDKQDWYSNAGSLEDSALDKEIMENAVLQAEPTGVGRSIVRSEGRTFYIAYERSELLKMTLALYVPEEKVLGPLHRYRAWFRSLFGAALVAVFGFSYSIFRSIHSPIRRMVQAFRKVENGDLNLNIKHKNNDEFQYMYGQFNIMVGRLRQSVQDVYHSKIMAQQSELKQLQSQINPHFLYNTYYMVHRMAGMHDFENVERATKFLGDYFIYITRNAVNDANLEQEWNHTLSYLEIQQMRFQSRIEADVFYQCEELGTLRIPRLIFQPLVENAYQHGLHSKTENGRIVLTLVNRLEENAVVFSVEDNGETLSEEKIKALEKKLEDSSFGGLESTGMINVHRRIRLRFGEKWGVRLEKSVLGGLKVSLYLPDLFHEAEGE